MANTTPELLTAEGIDSAFLPIEQARTLPSRAYFAEDFFELERERIFVNQWVGLCSDALVAQPGDCEPLWLAEMPLLLVRRHSGDIAVYHNLCPYDGCPVLLEGVRGVEVIEAAYHGWRYGLDGKLVQAPYWNGREQDDRSTIGVADAPLDLLEVSSAAYAHIVFVNVSGTASMTFDEFIAPMRASLSRFDVDRFEVGCDPESGQVSSYPTIVKCNWKIFIENDDPNIYHEGFVHAGYRASASVPLQLQG